MLVLLVLWFGISTPLVFLGAYFGYKADAIEFPVKTSNIPRQIPDQPWFMSTPFSLFIGGLLPFGACFVELYFILSSVWLDYYYYVFGFTFIHVSHTAERETMLYQVPWTVEQRVAERTLVNDPVNISTKIF